MSAFVSKKYQWRDGFSRKKDPEIVGKVLEYIEDRDGSVTPKAFLEESRSEDSETHDMFEWDNTVAAERYRLSQAVDIVGGITFTLIEAEEVKTEVNLVEDDGNIGIDRNVKAYKGWVNVSPKGRGRVGSPAVLVSIDRVMRDEELRKQALKNALSEVKMYTNKHRHFYELARIFSAIDETEQELFGDD